MEEIFSKSWEYFKQHWKFLVITASVGLFIPFIIMLVPAIMIHISTMQGDQSQMQGALLVIIGILSLAGCLVYLLTVLGLMKTSLMISNGATPSYSDLKLRGDTFLKLIGAYLLVFLLTFIGIVLCILPGIAVIIFTMFTPYVIINEPNIGVIDAIKKSVSMFKANWKDALIVSVIAGIITSIASQTVLGIIPAIPFSYLVHAVMYTKFNNAANGIGTNPNQNPNNYYTNNVPPTPPAPPQQY
ncbi:MAG: hypothetical protein K6F33_10185 [Bacteroidales bacterium]|nr:hypothetical protein [Bacteroidales bacterium]